MADSANPKFSQEPYKFLKVEEYFDNYKNWQKLGPVVDHSIIEPARQTLSLQFNKGDGSECTMLLQFAKHDTFRVRFNPKKSETNDYPNRNSRSIVQDNFKDTRDNLQQAEPYAIEWSETTKTIEAKTIKKQHPPEVPQDQYVMKVVVTKNPFSIEVYKYPNGEQKDEFLVWKTADTPIYYTPNGDEDYAIIQAVKKPANAKYIGFGEQGGKSLSKNTAQVNFFNFDNMRYRQVYNTGPLEGREPLYHSDPFFMEFYGVPGQDSVYGIFVDNPAQICIDVGFLNSKRYLLGTRFGDLDYYFFIGEEPADILESFTALIGRPRLKPRYVLGYHQGCYGYETRNDLHWVVDRYRANGFPLDGLHVDVDIQRNYQTFTIDTNKFWNPQEMFQQLKDRGIKCSTNITPIISNKDENYQTYKEGKDNNYFVTDERHQPDSPDAKICQDYDGGWPTSQDMAYPNNFNNGQPYIGEVYYGGERGTTGHYPDLAKKKVRQWWGEQYKYLFETGLEMVWQDMTTPAIRDNRGDMRSFPFRLKVSDDFLSATTSDDDDQEQQDPPKTPAIKVWNLFSYNLHKATYHGLNNLPGRENKRNFIIGRGSFAGMHRFAGLWTGDNSSSWDFLKMNVSQVLSVGMCGLTICGQDIGGFERENDSEHWASPELVIRWTLAGAFLPWFRNHYIRKGQKYFQEPFQYVECFERDGKPLPEPQDLYRLVVTSCRHYIQLRYRLLQLFYDAMFENIFDGMPICRPMFLNDPGDDSLYNDKVSFLDDQFFVRKDLLIAPILDPQIDPQTKINNFGKRNVYLPAGSDWYTFMDNRHPLAAAVEGGTTLRDYDASLHDRDSHIAFLVPIFVRAGAIIPTIELENYVGELKSQGKPNPKTLNIYPGESGEYTMYLDDGESRSSAPTDVPFYKDLDKDGNEVNKGEYRQVKITHKRTGATREINVTRFHDGYTPFEEYFFVAVLHDPSEAKGDSGSLKSINLNGQNLSLITGGSADDRSKRLNDSTSNAWYYNENINISFIKVFDDSDKISIKVDYV